MIFFTQIIHKKQTQNNTFKSYSKIENYSNTVQQLAYRGWHPVNRIEELLIREGWEIVELKEQQQ